MTVLAKSVLPVLVLTISTLTLSSAGAWERHAKTFEPNGKTVTIDAGGSCSGSNCRSTRHVHIGDGQDIKRVGTVSCYRDTCVGKIRITGPDGATFTRTIRTHR